MTALLLSCEHGGNEVPANLRACFTGDEEVLKTHRGMDLGALNLFQTLAPLAQHSQYATRSRLCIELNRSAHHPRLFSPYMHNLPVAEKEKLLRFYHQYRDEFTQHVQQYIRQGKPVVHVAVHSFTPVLDGMERTMDIGLLYDPTRRAEKSFCAAWQKALNKLYPALKVRMNKPYKGTSDGFPTALRRTFPQHYAGIELEVNQRFVKERRMDKEVAHALHDSLRDVLRSTAKKH